MNKQVLRARTWAGSSKTSSERQKQFSFDDENELECGANSPPTNSRIDKTKGTQADSRHKNIGDKKPQNWTIDLVHTMSLPDLNQLSHFTCQDELLKRSTGEHHMSWYYSLKSRLKSVSAVFISIPSFLEPTRPIIITSLPKILTLSFQRCLNQLHNFY